ncbi:MAG: adenylate/guanylate cyclase domain-containing protein [Gammaproteobacteria bacterium]|nr:adenylate/guanylate cyclase domain-containing protein [Gammaproteobacteria bacterium]
MNTENVTKSLQQLIDAEKFIEGTLEPKVVLFADLSGSTSYKAKHSIVDGLKRTFEHNQTIASCVSQHNGNVVKFIGDEVMAVFDDADDAVLAAIDSQRILKSLRASPAIQSRIGIHLGPVVYFHYEQSTTADPQGTTVDVAARIVACAKQSQILISEEVRSRLTMNVDVLPGKAFIPRGTSSVIQIHAIEFEGADTIVTVSKYSPILSDDMESVLAEATRKLNENLYADASILARRVMDVDERHPDATYIYGVCCAEGFGGDIEQGIRCLRETLENNPEHFRAMHFLAFLLWERYERNGMQSDLSEMVEITEKCHELSKVKQDRYTQLVSAGNLAYYLALTGGEVNLKRAEQLCLESDRFYEKIGRVFYSRFLDTFGYVLMCAEKIDEAENKFRQSVALDPDNSHTFIHLGELLSRKLRASKS